MIEQLEGAITQIKRIPDNIRLRYSGSFRNSDRGYQVLFDRYGLDSNVVLRRWDAGAVKQQTGTTFDFLHTAGPLRYWNRESLVHLEEQRPGIAKTLYQEFGILNYSRYPEELLIDQYDQRTNTDKPYGVIIYPSVDDNGAYLQFANNHGILRDLRDDLQGKYLLRIIEADSKYGLARALIGLNNRYGETQKISFALLRGHGTRESVQLGNLTDRGVLSLEDLKGKSAKKFKDFFVPNPMAVITSCNTGETNGLGERLAEVLQGRVMVPDDCSSLESVDTNINGDSITLTPHYTNGVRTKFYGYDNLGRSSALLA